jgi:DNA-binding transcriptional LysR family regulator
VNQEANQTPPTTASLRDTEIDIRSLRYFVAVAEELNFTRAAERMFVAQQAISRDIRRLEERLNTPLFVRTTRRVSLTPEGKRLLIRARELIVLHDQILDEVGPANRPIVMDLLSEGRETGPRILGAVRNACPELEFRGRYEGGLGRALRRLQSGEIDVALGRADWVGRPSMGLRSRLIRLEPLALLLPADHALAAEEDVPVAALWGTEIDVNIANPDAPEWSDLSRQFLELSGAFPTPPHLPAVGVEEQAHHLTRQGLPILTGVDHMSIPGGVVRRLVDPIPIYPWSLVWRSGLPTRILAPIETAAVGLAEADNWLALPDDAWLPEPEASRRATAAG